MFEQVFKKELTVLTSDTWLIETLWAEIKKQYGNRSRHYHNLNHLDHIIAELLPIRGEIKDWQIMVLSVAYHDIVYDPSSEHNEIKSVELAIRRLSQLGVDDVHTMQCALQIAATKDHEQTRNKDTNYLIDADLAILGAEAETYRQYARNIRKEFWNFPDFMYKPGRINALQHFLDRDFIYTTLYFREKYEQQARWNIAQELQALSR